MQGDFFLTNWFLEAMRWVYANIGSVFFTILICTVVLRGLTLISDVKTRKSSQKMQAIQPEIQRLQKKYKDDPQRMNREQQKLMKEHGVSMWGSCLPLLITMPLFFCFIAAFRYWGYEMTLRLITDEADQAMALFKSFKFLWVHNIWQPDNGLTSVVQEGARFLSTAGLEKLLYLERNPEIWQKLMDMGIAARTYFVDNSGVMQTSYRFLTNEAAIAAYTQAVQPFVDLYAGYNNGWFVLPILAGGSQFLSAWLLQRNQPKQDPNSPGAGSGKMMMYVLPIMSFVFCLSYNAAFGIYWTLSSILMILVNLYMNKKYPVRPVVKEEK